MVYNHWLDRKIRQYEENKTNVTYTICAKEMAAMKKTEEYGFLKEADSIRITTIAQASWYSISELFQTAENSFSKVQIKKAE